VGILKALASLLVNHIISLAVQLARLAVVGGELVHAVFAENEIGFRVVGCALLDFVPLLVDQICGLADSGGEHGLVLVFVVAELEVVFGEFAFDGRGLGLASRHLQRSVVEGLVRRGILTRVFAEYQCRVFEFKFVCCLH